MVLGLVWWDLLWNLCGRSDRACRGLGPGILRWVLGLLFLGNRALAEYSERETELKREADDLERKRTRENTDLEQLKLLGQWDNVSLLDDLHDIVVRLPESGRNFKVTALEVTLIEPSRTTARPRPGTPAAELRDQIPESVKSERLARLQTLLDRQRRTFNRNMAGRKLDVLIEKPGRHAGQIAGKSPYLQAVQIEGSVDRIGEIVRAEIVSAGTNSLFGRLLPDRAAREAPR